MSQSHVFAAASSAFDKGLANGSTVCDEILTSPSGVLLALVFYLAVHGSMVISGDSKICSLVFSTIRYTALNSMTAVFSVLKASCNGQLDKL